VADARASCRFVRWIQTEVEVERVVEDGRKISQVVARGNYGSEVSLIWAALSTRNNELARADSVALLGA
jgi:hypothetical protein